MAGSIADAMGLTICLADIREAQGRIHEAIRIHEQSLQLASEQGVPVVRGTTDLLLGLSMLHHERGDLKAAEQHLQRSEDLGRQAAFPFWRYRRCLALARIKKTQGDLDGALDLLYEAERLYFRNLFPNIRPISAFKTRVWIGQGRLDRAADWAHEQGLSVHDDLCYLR
jgi:LuxR family maltose regulon positive regulatory protein